MEKNKVTEPKQTRSIEKKQKIIRSGMKLITEKGYYNVTTDDIAAASGVSTGIVYRYFTDKKDILLAGLKLYIDSAGSRFIEELANTDFTDITSYLTKLMDYFVELHIQHYDVHEEIEAMRRMDKDVDKVYSEFTNFLPYRLSEILPADITSAEHFCDRIMLSVQLMEGCCHLIADGKYSDADYMKKLTIEYVADIIGLTK